MFHEFAPNARHKASLQETPDEQLIPSCKTPAMNSIQVKPGVSRPDPARQRTEQQWQHLNDEIARATVLADRLKRREDMLEEIYRSRSWRLTAPLRTLTDLLRNRGRHHAMAHLPSTPARNMGPDQPTIFIECTHTFHTELNTGIQRVVRNIVRYASVVAAESRYAVVPVIVEDGRFVAADIDVVLSDKLRIQSIAVAPPVLPETPEPEHVSFSRKLRMVLRPIWRGFLKSTDVLLPFATVRRFLRAPSDQRGLARFILAVWYGIRLKAMPPNSSPTGPMTLDDRPSCAADILLLLDSSWPVPLWPAVERFKRRGGRIAGVIYDIIPISHSYTCVPELVVAFKDWIDSHARNTDVFIAISSTIAGQLKHYLRAETPGNGPITRAPVLHFHLGSELDFIIDSKDVRPAIAAIFEQTDHVFLMVGSIEPRKNHAFVLDAFDRLWQLGERASLVIIGRHGWKTEDVFDRVAEHQLLGQQLFFLRDATDSELDHAYRNASALVIASAVEGFGLPVVEAFQRGLPVLCSDIPVFREIADGRATFFGLDDPEHLTAALLSYCHSHDPAARRDRTPQSWLTWRESTEQLLTSVLAALGETAKPADTRR
jgi:O-antigen biosynthesis alpha-1,2-rhamnosyltransferase